MRSASHTSFFTVSNRYPAYFCGSTNRWMDDGRKLTTKKQQAMLYKQYAPSNQEAAARRPDDSEW